MSSCPPDQRNDIEETRTDCSSRHGDTNGMNEGRRFHTSRVRHASQRRFERRRIEIYELRKRIVQGSKVLRHSIGAQISVDCPGSYSMESVKKKRPCVKKSCSRRARAFSNSSTPKNHA